jgi:hypothetical protein
MVQALREGRIWIDSETGVRHLTCGELLSRRGLLRVRPRIHVPFAFGSPRAGEPNDHPRGEIE